MKNEQDPFHLHLDLQSDSPEPDGATPKGAQATVGPTLAAKYEGAEHAWLGLHGAEAACAGDPVKLKMLLELSRPNDQAVLNYGEIVALSGDFYRTPEELFLQKPARLPWWKGSNDLATLRKAFASELTWIEDAHHTKGYPDNTITFAWTAKSYLELAEDNTAHFGWHNLKKYCENHALAIQFALQAKSQTSTDENWMRAMFFNGFADHFLTDGFAAGHIRVPRQQIREWAPTRGYDGKLAGFLSKVLHDQDGHVAHFHDQGEDPLDANEGLPVRNSLGDDWSTRCDGQLFLVKRGATDPLLLQPVTAVKESLLEVFAAQEQQRTPDGVYRALQHVPFPHPNAPSLSQKFADTSPERIKDLLESFAWYTELPFIDASLNQDNIKALFEALPQLMQKFGEAVAAEYAASEELRRRLPEPYVNAFKNIR